MKFCNDTREVNDSSIWIWTRLSSCEKMPIYSNIQHTICSIISSATEVSSRVENKWSKWASMNMQIRCWISWVLKLLLGIYGVLLFSRSKKATTNLTISASIKIWTSILCLIGSLRMQRTIRQTSMMSSWVSNLSPNLVMIPWTYYWLSGEPLSTVLAIRLMQKSTMKVKDPSMLLSISSRSSATWVLIISGSFSFTMLSEENTNSWGSSRICYLSSVVSFRRGRIIWIKTSKVLLIRKS